MVNMELWRHSTAVCQAKVPDGERCGATHSRRFETCSWCRCTRAWNYRQLTRQQPVGVMSARVDSLQVCKLALFLSWDSW